MKTSKLMALPLLGKLLMSQLLRRSNPIPGFLYQGKETKTLYEGKEKKLDSHN